MTFYLDTAVASAQEIVTPPPSSRPSLSAAGEYRGPNCLSGVCVSDRLRRPELLRRFGISHEINRNGDLADCFRTKDGKTFVQINSSGEHGDPEVTSIFISDRPNCEASKILRNHSYLPATPQGVGLGSSTAEVEKAYGKASKVEVDSGTSVMFQSGNPKTHEPKKRFGEIIWTFSSPNGELLVSEFYFRNGKVSAIWLSWSE